MIAGARLANGPDRVDVSSDEEEYGDGAAAAHRQAEEGQLEQVWGGLGVAGGRVQPGHESGAQMARHDHEGGNAAQALEVTVLAAVTQAGGAVWRYAHLSSWRRGEALCQRARETMSVG